MKVLIINTVPTEKNGITNVIFNYLDALNCQSIQMDLVMINDADYSYKDKVEKKGGKYYVIRRSAMKLLSYFLKLSQLINSEKYDAVHIHGNSHTMVFELLAAKLGGCKIRIVHSHNTTCYHPLIHKLLTPLFKKLYTHGFACGREAGEWLFGNGSDFYVLNNGIDTNRYAFRQDVRTLIRSRLGITDKEVLIGHIGHFDGKVKNQSFLVDIFNELENNDWKYRLCLIGDGVGRESIQLKVKESGLEDKVIFTGNINNVHDYLNAIDLIIMPSLHEGLPLSLIEQQANGLQCVCSDVITKESDKTGFLKFISLEEPASKWVENIILFVDLEGRSNRSKYAIKKIKEVGYSIQEEAEKLLNYYKKCIENMSNL